MIIQILNQKKNKMLSTNNSQNRFNKNCIRHKFYVKNQLLLRIKMIQNIIKITSKIYYKRCLKKFMVYDNNYLAIKDNINKNIIN